MVKPNPEPHDDPLSLLEEFILFSRQYLRQGDPSFALEESGLKLDETRAERDIDRVTVGRLKRTKIERCVLGRIFLSIPHITRRTA